MFTPSHKIINKQPGSDGSDRLNSFDEGVEGDTVTLESVLQSMGRSSERLPTAMVTYQSMGIPAESTLAPVSGVTALTCGIVPPVVRHSFNGHDSQWLDATSLKSVLGRVPDHLDRPSLLNALAFKCKNSKCEHRQCTRLLDEVNVRDLRQLWALKCGQEASFHSSSRDAVISTFIAHSEQGGKSFLPVSVAIVNRSGDIQKVSLCISSWAVVVANMGNTTMTKIRADIPNILEQQQCRTAVNLLTYQTKPTSMAGVSKSQGGDTFRLVVSWGP